MDFLGLENVDRHPQHPKKWSSARTVSKCRLINLPLDDKKTYDPLNRAETLGVFQLKSGRDARFVPEISD